MTADEKFIITNLLLTFMQPERICCQSFSILKVQLSMPLETPLQRIQHTKRAMCALKTSLINVLIIIFTKASSDGNWWRKQTSRSPPIRGSVAWSWWSLILRKLILHMWHKWRLKRGVKARLGHVQTLNWTLFPFTILKILSCTDLHLLCHPTISLPGCFLASFSRRLTCVIGKILMRLWILLLDLSRSHLRFITRWPECGVEKVQFPGGKKKSLFVYLVI